MRVSLAVLVAVAGLVPSMAAAQATMNHVAINVTDQARSVAYYEEAFGLSEIPAPLDAAPGGPRWLRLGNGVELHIQAIKVPFTPPPRIIHFALTVKDLDPVLAYLRNTGRTWTDYAGKVGAIKRTRTDGVRQIFTQDPDGYWVEVNDAADRPPR
ncbi:VOC family protein [Sphingomonas yunnanensis]|uniref:VOC family protein n=1 Tax=Sphingomonas yunnanensis TaxID=310400 RepID=UPI001CA749A1|nr:VOC family protein [Sphingomonas yunnanensis]MBY9061902.1 VOC family protein [Sphingomonas yunnanensis]